jgi:hypothetical protein
MQTRYSPPVAIADRRSEVAFTPQVANTGKTLVREEAPAFVRPIG